MSTMPCRRSFLCLLLLHLASAVLAASPSVLCFERIYNDNDTLSFLPHPSGDKALLARRDGLVSLVSLPVAGSGQNMSIISTFLDLRDRVATVGEEGFLGMAFHPNFASNGRFFVSYICDRKKHKDCRYPQVPCVCRPARICSGILVCRRCMATTIVAEYNVQPPCSPVKQAGVFGAAAIATAAGAGGYSNASSSSSAVDPAACSSVKVNPLEATALSVTESRRLLAFGRPYPNHMGGEIFFDSKGLFYYTSGDGGLGYDPCSFAQSGKVFFGKVLRLDVDNIPAGKPYGVPSSNPFVGRKGVKPEIYALGLRNPWRCDYDTVNDVITCGDVGQDEREEVDVIVSGGNYGWRCYEGTRKTLPCYGLKPLGQAFLQPVFEVHHPDSECIIGGLVYRGSDTCLSGLYLFNDLFGDLYAGNLYPYTLNTTGTYAKVPGKCASISPTKCSATTPFGGQLWSWGKDLLSNGYLLSDAGIFRLLPATACGAVC